MNAMIPECFVPPLMGVAMTAVIMTAVVGLGLNDFRLPVGRGCFRCFFDGGLRFLFLATSYEEAGG